MSKIDELIEDLVSGKKTIRESILEYDAVDTPNLSKNAVSDFSMIVAGLVSDNPSWNFSDVKNVKKQVEMRNKGSIIPIDWALRVFDYAQSLVKKGKDISNEVEKYIYSSGAIIGR